MEYVKHTSDRRTILTALEWLEFCISESSGHHVQLIDMGTYTISIYSAPEADYIFNHDKSNVFTSMTVVAKER